MAATVILRSPATNRQIHPKNANPTGAAIDHAVRLIHAICGLAGSASLINDIRADLRADKVQAAIRNRDTGPVFDDVADGDLVGWIDRQLATANSPPGPERLARMRGSLIGPLREVYGLSDKVLTMALSCILLGAPTGKALWAEVGGSMIAIDTLVHNFLHRTGILARFKASHAYGTACYRSGNCAEIIDAIADRIDARQFNASYPQPFPRFVQHAIWRYCSQTGLDVCNGNRMGSGCGLSISIN